MYARRMLILSFSLCKNVGYKKIHHLEYDCEILDDSELENNSKLLDEYDFIYYMDKQKNVDDILFGSFQSYKVESIPNVLINLDENWIKNLIRNTPVKSPEGMLKNILIESGKSFQKNRNVLETNGNKFATSEKDDGFTPWGVPFIDLMDNRFKFIIWNTKKDKGVTHNIIINNNKIYNSENLPKGHWRMIDLGSYEEVNKIVTIEDNKIRDILTFDSNMEKETFKKVSFRYKKI